MDETHQSRFPRRAWNVQATQLDTLAAVSLLKNLPIEMI